MFRHHRWIGAVGALAIGLAAAPAAMAASPSHSFDRGVEITSVNTWMCEFPVTFRIEGWFGFKATLDDAGSVVVEHSWLQFHGTFTNPANGRSVTSHASGGSRTVYAADGTLSIHATEHTDRHSGGLIALATGSTKLVLHPTGEVDDEGFPIYDEEVVAQSGAHNLPFSPDHPLFVETCAALAD